MLHVQVYPGRTALVVSLENITENVYLGNQRSMTITNCLFRLGGAAALLSNKRRHWWTARSATAMLTCVSYENGIFREAGVSVSTDHRHRSSIWTPLISCMSILWVSRCTMQVVVSLGCAGGDILGSVRIMLACCCRYELQHMVWTHMGSDDEAYHCISQQEDSEGLRGVKLDKVHTPSRLKVSVLLADFQAANGVDIVIVNVQNDMTCPASIAVDSELYISALRQGPPCWHATSISSKRPRQQSSAQMLCMRRP